MVLVVVDEKDKRLALFVCFPLRVPPKLNSSKERNGDIFIFKKDDY